MPASHLDVTPVIVTFNAAKFIGACLDAVSQSGTTAPVVWDNNSTDNTLEEIRNHPLAASCTLISSPSNLGFSRAVNHAAKHATSEFILLLNPDCLINSEALSTLIGVLSEHPDIGAVSPMMRYPNGRPGYAGGTFPSLLKEFVSFTRLDDALPKPVRRRLKVAAGKLAPRSSMGSLERSAMPSEGHMTVDWASGFCLLIRRDAWEATGGLDEGFFLYYEDVAFGHSLRTHGYRAAVATSACVVHDESASTLNAGKSQFYRTSMITYFRNYGSRRQQVMAKVVRELR